MTEEDVVSFLVLFEQERIDIWIDGGWGVDALLGHQTRVHSDLDIAVRHADVARIRSLLSSRGFHPVHRDDTKDFNFVLGDDSGRRIDVHSFAFDAAGNHIYGCAYPRDSLAGSGFIAGRAVKCISLEWMLTFHTRYTPDATDYQDVLALCSAFNIPIPREFKRFPTI